MALRINSTPRLKRKVALLAMVQNEGNHTEAEMLGVRSKKMIEELLAGLRAAALRTGVVAWDQTAGQA